MQRIRDVLDHGINTAVEARPTIEPYARLASAEDDVVTMFAERATLVGMQVQRLKRGDVKKALATLFDESDVKQLSVAMAAGELCDVVHEAARSCGATIIDGRGREGVDKQFDIDAGVTDVEAALAESGTLVCGTDPAHGRAPSLVPPIHIAIVQASQILPDMFDLWAKFNGTRGLNMPSSIAFITGPSKTADIEGVLITGVHGPGAVHILIVEDE